MNQLEKVFSYQETPVKTVVIGASKRLAKQDFIDWIHSMKGGESSEAS